MLNIERLDFVDKKMYEYMDYRLNKENFEIEKKAELEDLYIEYGTGPISNYRKMVENFQSVKNVVLMSRKDSTSYFSYSHLITGLPELLDGEGECL